MTPNFPAPACMHSSPVAALALRPSGACQTYQSPPQPPGPRRGGRLSALSAQPLSTGGCGRVCLGFWGRKESGSGLLTVSDPGLILPESACRWPQVFHTQGIRLCPMTLFNPVFNCLTPIVIKRSKTQAEEGLTTTDEAGYVVLRQPPASKLANLFRNDVRDHALGLVTQQLGGRVTEHPPGGWLGPRTPSLREGPGSASVPSGSPDPAAGTGARALGNEPSQLSPESRRKPPSARELVRDERQDAQDR